MSGMKETLINEFKNFPKKLLTDTRQMIQDHVDEKCYNRHNLVIFFSLDIISSPILLKSFMMKLYVSEKNSS
jgi:hypothetical protein